MTSNETEVIDELLPRTPQCGSVARELLEGRLGAELAEARLADAKLVVSELVNNAFLHGNGRIALRVLRLPGRLRLEVTDDGRGQAIQINREPTDRGGRGLRIVDALALTWGAFEGTTHVWAEIAA